MAASKDRKTRVVWTNEELTLVVQEAVRLSLKDEDFIWAFVSKGQKVLLQDRQRVITGKNGINPKTIGEFCHVRQEILETGVPFEVVIEKEVLVERPRKDILASITTEELLGLFASRLAPIIELIPVLIEKASEKLETTREVASPSGRAEERALEERTARNPRVLLYGFLPQQEMDIREKSKVFNLDLRFQKKEGRQSEPPPSCQWCVVINKISHPAWNKLKKNFGGRIRLVEGVTQAMQILADINSQVCSGVR